MAYLKYWYPSRVYDIVNMIYQAQNILLPMAVAKLTHNLAGSLSAHCVRIPALVQTTSFLWETITIQDIFCFVFKSSFYFFCCVPICVGKVGHSTNSVICHPFHHFLKETCILVSWAIL